jgi:hypothetical protein
MALVSFLLKGVLEATQFILKHIRFHLTGRLELDS